MNFIDQRRPTPASARLAFQTGRAVSAALVGALLVLPGCATYKRRGLEPARAAKIEQEIVCREIPMPRELEDRILALDATRISDQDVREVLAKAPAPRVFNIHGGVFPVHRRMISFSEFLVGMGYPRDRIQNPGDGTYTFSCYESSEVIAGIAGWYYERDGMRPMLVGHSQGAMQAVKVLYKLDGRTTKEVHVFNPLTWEEEERCEIMDPLTGEKRPVIGLHLSYVTGVGGGGLTRFLPNQWVLCGRLRKIPDSAEEFTGFFKGKDLLGGDFLGYGPSNEYHPINKAQVRNVRLPSKYRHGSIPDTEHLLKSEQIKDWINAYTPAAPPELNEFDADSRHILWAADVWYSVKKHWTVELQRLIAARRAPPESIPTGSAPQKSTPGATSALRDGS